MKKHKKNKASGITLIALVVTIIVLLLLAGISIQMLTGDNGILQRAGDAKTMTDEAQIKERIQLAYHSALTKDITEKNDKLTMQTLQEELEKEFTGKTVTITENSDKKEWIIAVENVELSVKAGKKVATLPTGAGTKPYLPNAEVFSQVDGTDLTNGLVITDQKDEQGKSIGNEYVWVEVPNANLGDETPTFGPNYSAQGLTVSEITDETIDANKGKIEAALWAYTNSLITRLTTINTNIDDKASKTTTMGWKDEFYEGCGVADSTTYNNMYKAMLKSVYNHGGFWVGRYEAGITEARTAESGDIDASLKPLSKQNVYPINFVTCSQAQILSSRINNINSEYNSSLMFGVQWDMVLKYLENKATWNQENTASYYLTSDSSSWGEYSGTNLTTTIANAKERTFITNSWKNVENNTRSSYGGPVLSSTGSLVGTDKMNIFDLAGNLYEWTLEHATSDRERICSDRGGGFVNNGIDTPASWRYCHSVDCPNVVLRFSCLTLLKYRPET